MLGEGSVTTSLLAAACPSVIRSEYAGGISRSINHCDSTRKVTGLITSRQHQFGGAVGACTYRALPDADRHPRFRE